MQRLARPLFRIVPDNTRIHFMRGARIGLHDLGGAVHRLGGAGLLSGA